MTASLSGVGRRWSRYLTTRFQTELTQLSQMLFLYISVLSLSTFTWQKSMLTTKMICDKHNQWQWKPIAEYQGYKCKDCSMMVHKKCIRLVNESCTAEGAIQISGDQLIIAVWEVLFRSWGGHSEALAGGEAWQDRTDGSYWQLGEVQRGSCPSGDWLGTQKKESKNIVSYHLSLLFMCTLPLGQK